MRHVIIGGGAAGIKAAEQIRTISSDAEIVIVMEDMSIHSRCMLHKFLAGERDEVTMSFLPEEIERKLNLIFYRGYTVSFIDTERKKITIEAITDLAKNDESNKNKDGKVGEIAYDKLLIATGSNGFVSPAPGLRAAKNVFCFRHLSEAKAIRERLETCENFAIIGAGLVGIDAAYGLLELGKNVTVIDMAERMIPMQLCDEAASTYQKVFEEHGCRFSLGRKVADTRLDDNGNIISIVLDDGSEVPCDLVIVAAGERAALGPVEGSTIKHERFIEVDDHMRTSAKDVFAAGNVTGLSGTWPNAKKQAEVAAENMCGGNKIYEDTYAMKNTMNFYGLITLSLGSGKIEEGDKVIEQHDSFGYRRTVLKGGVLDSIILQGRNLNYVGVYQYIIKNKIDLTDLVEDDENEIFKLSFADFYGIDRDGQYKYA